MLVGLIAFGGILVLAAVGLALWHCDEFTPRNFFDE